MRAISLFQEHLDYNRRIWEYKLSNEVFFVDLEVDGPGSKEIDPVIPISDNLIKLIAGDTFYDYGNAIFSRGFSSITQKIQWFSRLCLEYWANNSTVIKTSDDANLLAYTVFTKGQPFIWDWLKTAEFKVPWFLEPFEFSTILRTSFKASEHRKKYMWDNCITIDATACLNPQDDNAMRIHLVNHVLSLADESNLPVCTELLDRKLVGLYEALGFQIKYVDYIYFINKKNYPVIEDNVELITMVRKALR